MDLLCSSCHSFSTVTTFSCGFSSCLMMRFVCRSSLNSFDCRGSLWDLSRCLPCHDEMGENNVNRKWPREICLLRIQLEGSSERERERCTSRTTGREDGKLSFRPKRNNKSRNNADVTTKKKIGRNQVRTGPFPNPTSTIPKDGRGNSYGRRHATTTPCGLPIC